MRQDYVKCFTLKISIKHFIFLSRTNHPPPHPLISQNHWPKPLHGLLRPLITTVTVVVAFTYTTSLSLSLNKASLVELFQTLNSATCQCHQRWWGLLILTFSISLSHFLSPNQTLILTLQFLTLPTPSLLRLEPKGKLETHGDLIR